MGKQLASVAQFRRRMVSTVAILAQGTIWAVAASQAFFAVLGFLGGSIPGGSEARMEMARTTKVGRL